MITPRARNLERVMKKMRRGEKVKIGVFCSGNGDRSPLLHQVLQTEFEKAGYRNVSVFSFGTSVSPTSHHGPAATRTSDFANEIGYSLAEHSRRHIGDADVQADIAQADLLFAVSPSHLDLAAEYSADEAPGAHRHILQKGWTAVGFARKREWTKPIRRLVGLARGLALKDPYFHPYTPAGNELFKKDLLAVVATGKGIVSRLTGKRVK